MSDATKAPDWLRRLERLHACQEASKWATTQPDLETAWQNCERGDWLLWYAARVSGKRGSDAHRTVVLAACACARTALRHVPAGEPRPWRAIDTTERWARRESGVAIERVRAAADAADAAAATAYAAYAAADAADADAAAADAAAAYAADARASSLRECANIVRSFIPHAPGGDK